MWSRPTPSTATWISRLYRISEADVLELVAFEPAAAIKITIRRPRTAGDVGETDVYGAQQHAPLLGVVLDLPGRGRRPRHPLRRNPTERIVVVVIAARQRSPG